ncbi:MAG TPA: secretin N-terminal domain-containing protein [Acetobacteraceae bacterium]|nr:secretin N-terminal domain-containing protein [Acetobacteraceae bacterium]
MALPSLPETTAGAPPRVNGNVGSPQGLPPAELSYGTRQQQASAAGSPGNQGPGDISLDFADTDIRAVVAQILGTTLKLNYTIDPAVHGTATLRTDTPLSRSQLLPVLQSLLAENGAALVQSGSLYRVVPIAQAAAVAAAEGTAGAEPVPLRYASAEDLAKVLQPFVGADGKITADAGRNVLLVNGTPETREGLISLIHAFDIDVLSGQSYALLPVENGGAKDFANALQDAFHGHKSGPVAGLVRVVPMECMNAVLVIAANPRSIEQMRRVYQLVERERSRTVRSWHVYYLQNSHAEDVAYVLQQAFTPNNVTAQPSARRTSVSGVWGHARGRRRTGRSGCAGWRVWRRHRSGWRIGHRCRWHLRRGGTNRRIAAGASTAGGCAGATSADPCRRRAAGRAAIWGRHRDCWPRPQHHS